MKQKKCSEVSLSSSFPRARGIALLEALVSILILSIGVLGLVGLQSRAIGYVDESGYRAEAVSLVGGYAAQLWSAKVSGTGGQLADQFADTNADQTSPYGIFSSKVTQTLKRTSDAATLLGVSNPQVMFTALPQGGTSVTIAVHWMMPEDASRPENVHSYQQVTVLGFNP